MTTTISTIATTTDRVGLRPDEPGARRGNDRAFREISD